MNNTRRRLLDWKLDFSNPVLALRYDSDFNLSIARLCKVTCAICVVAVLGFPVVETVVHGAKFFNFEAYAALYIIAIWAAVFCFPLFFIQSLMVKYAGIIATLTFCGMAIIFLSVDFFIPSNYMFDEQSFYVPALTLLFPLVLRLRIKWTIIPNFIIILLQLALSLSRSNTRFGFVMVSFITLAFQVFCGYYFERRWKFDFLREQFMKAEAAKLSWIVARDASLLRNIFPKNLSDELEIQMTSKPRQKPDDTIDIESPRIIKAISNIVSVKKQTEKQNLEINRQRSNTAPIPLSVTSSLSSTSSSFVSSSSSSSSSSLSSSHLPSLMRSISQRARNKRHSLLIQIEGNTETQSPEIPHTPSGPKRFPSLSVSIPINPTRTPPATPPSIPIIFIPPVVTTPSVTPTQVNQDFEAPFAQTRVIYSSGTPLRTPNHQPELHTYMTGTQHIDGSSIALSHSYPNVIVVLADIVGFTTLSSYTSPQTLVALLNTLFTQFDDIMDRYKLEKIRTIGDAYLCVGNMSMPLADAEEKAIEAALEMIRVVQNVKDFKLSVRVGIASGPLIAGITGITKWNYDIFGRTLAMATEMETLAPPNCVSITKSIFDACKTTTHNFLVSTKNETEKYYTIEATSDGADFSTEGSTVDSDSIMLLQQPSLEEVGRQVVQYPVDEIMGMQNVDSFSDIPLSDFSFDISQKLGYSNDELETEEKNLKSKLISFGFINPAFETDFRIKTIETVKPYTISLSFLYSATSILFLVTQFAISARTVPLSAKIIFPATSLISLLYIAFVKKFDHWTFSSLVALLYILWFGLSFVLVAIRFFAPVNVHFMWVIIVILFMAAFIRAPWGMLLLSQGIIAVLICICAYLDAPDMQRRPRFVILILTILVFSVCTQFYFQKSFRSQYLAQKRVKLDMFHQTVGQHRAKLLLHNILPADIIPRLKLGSVVVDLFEEATMMFVNIINLEELTSELKSEPSHAFQVHNDLFTLFDEATKSFGLEKIKTINSVYMVAGGLPKKTNNHVDKTLQLAIELYRITTKYNFPLLDKKFKLRIGIATGPVIAGIIGKKKYAYDCWSDTTNTASRMESNGWPGYVQLTESSFNLLQQKNLFQKRENVFIKGKGSMHTYVLQLSKYVNT